MAKSTLTPGDQARIMATMMIEHNHKAVEYDEKDWTARVARHFQRSWEHGGLKKTVTKIGIGAAVGVVTVTASAVTGGLALPVIIAVAAGSYAVGQMTGIGTAALWGRSLKGARATRNFMDGFRSSSDDEKKGSMFALEERVHKTIRRSLQHYRKAAKKYYQGLKPVVSELKQNQQFANCSAAWDIVMECFSVDHHLHKGQVYLEPAVYLLRMMLDVYEGAAKSWKQYEAVIQPALEKHFASHNGEVCNSATICLFEGEFELVTAPPPDAYTPWDAAKIARRKKRLDAIGTDLLRPKVDAQAPQTTHATPGSPERLTALFSLVGRTYRSHMKSPTVRIKHYFENSGARKTKAERGGVIAGQVLALGGAVGGAAVGGVTSGLDLADWTDPVIELASEVVTNTADWVNEKAVEAVGSGENMDIAHHAGATHVGSESQESLQKAAIHLSEALRRLEEMKGGVHTNCDVAAKYAYAHAKAEHHLRKTEIYIEDAYTQVKRIGYALISFDTSFARNARAVHRIAHRLVRGDHAGCGTGRCFGPSSRDPKVPVRPFV